MACQIPPQYSTMLLSHDPGSTLLLLKLSLSGFVHRRSLLATYLIQVTHRKSLKHLAPSQFFDPGPLNSDQPVTSNGLLPVSPSECHSHPPDPQMHSTTLHQIHKCIPPRTFFLSFAVAATTPPSPHRFPGLLGLANPTFCSCRG